VDTLDGILDSTKALAIFQKNLPVRSGVGRRPVAEKTPGTASYPPATVEFIHAQSPGKSWPFALASPARIDGNAHFRPGGFFLRKRLKSVRKFSITYQLVCGKKPRLSVLLQRDDRWKALVWGGILPVCDPHN
jgi:hypothetical protein